ncbi:MAG: amidohydrolase [Bacteroidota bacterium]|nr:amidohydrolase [Bacteroidota bacterium]
MNRFLSMILIGSSILMIGCRSTTEPDKKKSKEPIEYKGPIIDMHIHAFGEGNPLFGLTHPPTLRGETYEGVSSPDELKKEVLERFTKYNIVKAVVTDGMRWYDDAPSTVLIANANQPVDSLRKQFEKGKLQVIGEMSPFYAGITADDPSQEPYFALAEELGIPVGFHILPGGPNNGIHLMPEMLGGMRAYNANPMQLEEVLVKHPKLKLYIMHGGWPYVDDVKALLYAHSNLYVDIAVINWVLPEEELYRYLKALIKSGFGDRIMYGSDQMVWPQTIDVGIETIQSADFLTLEQKEDIFYGNASRFLNLEKEEKSEE